MSTTKDRLLGLPRDDDDEIDFDALETDEVAYEDLSEWDILVDYNLQWVGLVVCEPVWDVRVNSDTMIHVPAISYRAIPLLVDHFGPAGPNELDVALQVFHDIALNIGMERGTPKDTAHVVSASSLQPL